jgi:hypothetical protein
MENLIHWSFLKAAQAHKLKENALFDNMQDVLDEEKVRSVFMEPPVDASPASHMLNVEQFVSP